MALVDCHHRAVIDSHESQLSIACRVKTHVRTIIPRLVAAYRWMHVHIAKPTESPHLVKHDLTLKFQLCAVINMLPMTATAHAKMLATRHHTGRRRLSHLNDLCVSKASLVLRDVYLDTFIGHRIRHENRAPL